MRVAAGIGVTAIGQELPVVILHGGRPNRMETAQP